MDEPIKTEKQNTKPAADFDINQLMKDQAVHLQGFKNVGGNTYKQVIDCSGEIYTSDGKIGTAGHCSPENVDVFKVISNDGKERYALKTSAIDRKNDLAVLQLTQVQNGEFKNIPLSSEEAKSGDSASAIVFERGANTSKNISGTIDDEIEVGQFVGADKIVAGQDINQTEQKLFVQVTNGGSGALVVDTDTNKAAGILDYANKKGEAIMIPIAVMKDLLSK